MPVRWKLNVVVGLLVVVFLLTAGLAMRAVRGYMAYARTHAAVRVLADLTATVHVGVYRHLLVSKEESRHTDSADRADWFTFALRDLDRQIRVSEAEDERELWKELRAALGTLDDLAHASPERAATGPLVARIDETLAALRTRYHKAEFDAVDALAASGELAQQAIWIAGGFIMLLFMWYVILVREWLVKPVASLKSAADAIGADEFQGHIPLEGTDELAQLARHMETMVQRLSAHQKELLKARELSAVGELCTSVAHGLRNPLAAMKNAADLDKYPEAGVEQLETVVKDVMRQADRMSERITKLMEFSRPRELHHDRVTFRQIALTAQAHVRELYLQHDVTLTIDDQSETFALDVDRDELAHALVELAANALRYCAAGSEVVVRAVRAEGEQMRIEVIDQGAGMSPAEVKRAFDIFYTTRADGTGMGLAMVRRAVDRQGGEVTLDSQVGKGTTVSIVLPGTKDEQEVKSEE